MVRLLNYFYYKEHLLIVTEVCAEQNARTERASCSAANAHAEPRECFFRQYIPSYDLYNMQDNIFTGSDDNHTKLKRSLS